VKVWSNVVAVTTAILLMAATGMAAKGRKLPPDAYIKTAKIEIIEAKGDSARINTAIAMLDSLIMNHGPRPEAYYWMTKIMVDLSNAKTNPRDKQPYVERLVAYADSLKWCCQDEKIEKKLREKCDDFLLDIDSANVYVQWRDFYNDGIARLTSIDELSGAMRAEADSTMAASYKRDLDAAADTAHQILSLALLIYPNDQRSLRAMASLAEKTQQWDTAIVYLQRAIPVSESPLDVCTAIAYDYIQKGDYCGAIPWFRQFVDSAVSRPEMVEDQANREAVLSTMNNLSICYNNCEQYDSAYSNFRRLLTLEPASAEALIGVGRFQRQKALEASDSANYYQKQGDTKLSAEWQAARETRFDSSRVFLMQATELKPDDPRLLDEYCMICAIMGQYQQSKPMFGEARDCFKKLTELEPTNVDGWMSLGDCHLFLADFPSAAQAYEKVIELRPTEKVVLEKLLDLYDSREAKNASRRAEIQKMLQNL